MISWKYVRIKKEWFGRLYKGNIKRMSALNNLRKNGTSLALGEDELLVERVGSYPYLYDKTFKEYKEKGVVENVCKRCWKTRFHRRC